MSDLCGKRGILGAIETRSDKIKSNNILELYRGEKFWLCDDDTKCGRKNLILLYDSVHTTENSIRSNRYNTKRTAVLLFTARRRIKVYNIRTVLFDWLTRSTLIGLSHLKMEWFSAFSATIIWNVNFNFLIFYNGVFVKIFFIK